MTAQQAIDTQSQAASEDSPTLPILQVRGLTKSYPSKAGPALAITSVDVDVQRGEFVSIVGPSGCGKSTLLNCIAGLLKPTGGSVSVSGVAVGDQPPDNMSVVFQDYSRSLFQWFTVEKNIALPLRRSGKSRSTKREEVTRILEDVGLSPDVRTRYPWQLSGGMQQRVAIARGLISRPEILLMDEPFASVDAQTRMSLEDLVLRLWQQWKKSILFVTHDIDEAIYVSDRVVVLTKGPSSVRAVIDVPLPRPRSQLDTRRLPEFAELRSQVLELVLEGDPGTRGVE